MMLSAIRANSHDGLLDQALVLTGMSAFDANEISLATEFPFPLFRGTERELKSRLAARHHIAGQVIEIDGASGADKSISPSPAIE